MKPVLNVVAIGGPHQFAHFLPVAFELQRRGNCHVAVFVPEPADAVEIAVLADELGAPLPEIATMDLPPAVEACVPPKARKLARLLAWTHRIRAGSAVLCAERTSTILKRLPGRCPPLIHIPHGAGDRAVGFEKRFALFDKVIVAGRKDRERLLAERVVSPERCAVAGPIKVSTMLRLAPSRPPLFDDGGGGGGGDTGGGRPVILYNPHFSKRLSSAQAITRRLVETITRDDRYNLVIAPHLRMAQNWPASRRREWEDMAVPGRVAVDLGSRRSVDMTYTLGADLYLGDVSSQVYEFLVRPRPCLFVNAHGAAWQGSEDYAMWRFGEVIAPEEPVASAIERAFARHGEFLAVQRERTRAALDGVDWDEHGRIAFHGGDPAAKAADIIEADMLNAPGMGI